MLKKTYVIMLIGIAMLLTMSSRGFAQLMSADVLPIHLLVENVKAGAETPIANDNRISISFEGTIKQIYKYSFPPPAVPLSVHDKIKFNINCLPSGVPPGTPRVDGGRPLNCEPLKKASSMELWSDYPVKNGNTLIVGSVQVR